MKNIICASILSIAIFGLMHTEASAQQSQPQPPVLENCSTYQDTNQYQACRNRNAQKSEAYRRAYDHWNMQQQHNINPSSKERYPNHPEQKHN